MKISDNNIENIFNINIYISGVFSNNIEQDVISVLVSLLNKQSVEGGAMTLKDQLLELAKKAKSKGDADMDINIPASSLTPSLNFDGLAAKLQSVLTNKSSGSDALLPANLEEKAKQLLSQYKGAQWLKLLSKKKSNQIFGVT